LSNRNKKLYDDPIWLRVDDLFGRDPAGHLEIGAVRWNKEDLLDQLIKLNEKKPRAVIVFDNVQAAPLDVRWLATKLRDSRDVQMIFLSWDKEALPPTRTIIHLDTLPFSASQQIIFHYCSPEQAQDKKGIQDLCRLLDDHPLLLDLAGRQLNLLSSSLSVAELVSSLKDRIALEGPTIDREHVQVETVLRESYHCLEFHERQVLGSLAIAPSRGVSQETMNWMITRLRRQDQTTRLDRAEHLGLLESRMKPDWHGHRYCLRPLIAEFLQTTDAFRESRIKFEEYLSSREALKDSSSDIVVLALERQLKELLLLEFPDNREWLDMLAVDARSEMRSRVHNVLINIKDQQQIIALQDALLEILKTPRPEEITVELIQLIGHWDTSSARQGLERLWLRPLCSTDDEYEKDPELSRDIRAEASNFLAKLEGKSLADFLIQYIRGLDHKRRNASLDTAAHRECTEALPAIFDLLKHTNPRIRQTAVDALGDYIGSPEVSDQLWELFQNDLDDEVKYRTAMALGVRGDKRILPYLLSKLMDMNADADIRAETCSVFWNYKPQDLPLDRLAEVAVHDPDMNTRVNTTVILVSFGDERGAEPILQLLRASDNKQRRYGVHFVSMAETGTPLYDALRRAAIDILVENFLNSSEIGLRLLARAALLHLRDKRGYQGLWTDVRYDASSKFIDTYRWFVISQFAEWVPPDFDPIHLRSLIHDQDPKMRKIAALVTGQVGARVLIKDLETLLEDHSKPLDDEKTVAEYASEALDRIAGKRERWKPFPRTKKFS
jgi:HEAT repeat protein